MKQMGDDISVSLASTLDGYASLSAHVGHASPLANCAISLDHIFTSMNMIADAMDKLGPHGLELKDEDRDDIQVSDLVPIGHSNTNTLALRSVGLLVNHFLVTLNQSTTIFLYKFYVAFK
ncbi:hypothetical protein Hdeb2414_s0027g00686331 [Helianthus debilis subsp. tardiflorus]